MSTPTGFTPFPASVGKALFCSFASLPSACSITYDDPQARHLEFGAGNILRFPVQTAVNTGTSNDHRDSWAIFRSSLHRRNLDGQTKISGQGTTERIEWLVDGTVAGVTGGDQGHFMWPVTPGIHMAQVRVWPGEGKGSLTTPAVRFVVK